MSSRRRKTKNCDLWALVTKQRLFDFHERLQIVLVIVLLPIIWEGSHILKIICPPKTQRATKKSIAEQSPAFLSLCNGESWRRGQLVPPVQEARDTTSHLQNTLAAPTTASKLPLIGKLWKAQQGAVLAILLPLQVPLPFEKRRNLIRLKFASGSSKVQPVTKNESLRDLHRFTEVANTSAVRKHVCLGTF